MIPGRDVPSPWGPPAPARPIHDTLGRGLWAGGTIPTAPRTRASGGHRAWRAARSSVALATIAVSLGVAVAAGLAGLVWLIAAAIHHAAAN
jgi:hypothetical protein